MNMVHRELLTQLPLRRDLEFGVVIKGRFNFVYSIMMFFTRTIYS